MSMSQSKNRRGHHRLLEHVEGELRLICPCEAFLGQLFCGDDPIAWHKLTVVSSKSKESIELRGIRWCWPARNGLGLVAVRGDAFPRNDMPR